MADPTSGFSMPDTSTSGSASLPQVVSQAGTQIKQILADLKAMDTTLGSILQKAQGIGSAFGLSSGAMGGGSGQTNSNGMPIPSFGGGSGGSSGIGGYSVAGALGAAAGAAVTSHASNFGSQIAFNTGLNSLALQTGQPFSGNGQPIFQGLVQNVAGGFTSQADLQAASASMLQAGWGSALMSQPGRIMASFGAATNSNLSSVAGMEGSLVSNPMAVLMARAHGINLMGPNGGPANMYKMLSQTVQATWANGNTPTVGQMNTAMSPYGALRQNLLAQGLSNEQIAQMQPLLDKWAAQGGTGPITAADSVETSLQKTTRGAATSSATVSANNYNDKISSANAANLVKIAANTQETTNTLGKLYAAVTNSVGGFQGGLGHDSAAGGALSEIGKGALFFGGSAVARRVLGGIGSRASSTLASNAARSAARSGTSGYYKADSSDASFESHLGAEAGDGGLDPLGGLPIVTGEGNESLAELGDDGSGLGLGALLATSSSTGGANTATAAASASQTATGGITNLLQYAMSFIGIPYVWGGTGGSTGGYDCSGFVQAVFAHYGIQLPRTTWEQVKCGVPVAPKDAQPGDLVFMDNNGHVGIYLGNNKFINAPHTGTTIQVDSIDLAGCSAIRRVTKATISGTTSANAGSNPDNSMSGVPSLLMSTMSSASSAANLLGMSGVGASLGNLLTSDAGNGGSGTAGSAVTSATPSGGTYNFSQLEQLAQSAGFTADQARIMAAIGLAESGGHPTDLNNDPSTGDLSYGLWQINMIGNLGPGRRKEFGITNNDSLFNAQMNAKAARDIYNSSGFDAWTTYKDGAYTKFLQSFDKGAWRIGEDQVAKIHKDEMILPAEFSNAVRDALGGAGASRVVHIHAHFTGTSDADARRLVTMVKRELEDADNFETIGSA